MDAAAHRRKGGHIEHWLNGAKVVEYELWSPDWEAKVASTKFKAWPKFGRAKTGHSGAGRSRSMLASATSASVN